MILARVLSMLFALLAICLAYGWLVAQNTPHAVGLVAASLLAFVLSTVPVGRVP